MPTGAMHSIESGALCPKLCLIAISTSDVVVVSISVDNFSSLVLLVGEMLLCAVSAMVCLDLAW